MLRLLHRTSLASLTAKHSSPVYTNRLPSSRIVAKVLLGQKVLQEAARPKIEEQTNTARDLAGLLRIHLASSLCLVVCSSHFPSSFSLRYCAVLSGVPRVPENHSCWAPSKES